MDREIDPVFRKKQIARRVFFSASFASLVFASFWWGPGWLKPSISRARIRTAKVDVGPVEATITASGTVVPELEQVLSSPIDARVLRILKRPGAVLRRGEPILELDVSQSILALEKIDQQIELKQNQQAKARLDLESALIGLQSQWEVKNLEVKSLKSDTARNRALFKQGLLSEDVLRKAELQEEKAGFELKQLQDSRRNAEESTRTQVAGLALEMKTLEQERVEARRQLELATTKSDRDGVLTWVVPEEGATARKGEVLARIADLQSFRVQATVSDVYAGRLAPGQPVSVKINEAHLAGAVTSIDPTIKNGVVTLLIALEEKSSPLLRSNLRVDVLLLTERRDRALRIKRGPFANAEGAREVFVVRGETAVKVPVQIGVASFEHYEVAQGLLEGDEVIISDMNDFLHVKEVRLK